MSRETKVLLLLLGTGLVIGAAVLAPGKPDPKTFLVDPDELDSPDQPGSGRHMDRLLMDRLRKLSKLQGEKLRINSGYRSPAHNRKVGGVSNSSHLHHLAVDIHAPDPVALAVLAYKVGFRRIGIGRTFIHVDTADHATSQHKKNPAFWVYPTSLITKAWASANIPRKAGEIN